MKNRCTDTNVEPPATDLANEDQFVCPESEAIDEDIDEPSNQNAGTVSDGKEKTVAKEYSPRIKFRKITPIQQFLGKCEQRAKGRDELRQKLLLESKTVPEKDALHQFFMAMYSTTKQLPAPHQRQIRNKIFQVVSETEEQYELNKSRYEPDVQTTLATPTTSASGELSVQFPEFFRTGQSLQNDSDSNTMSSTSTPSYTSL